MEGGDKAQLRQRLLASENDVNTLSGFAAKGKSQFNMINNFQEIPMQAQNGYPGQPHQQNYSNHDIMTPVLDTAYAGSSSSRKASMNSMSMQKFFRRKGPDNGAFDEEAGADIGDFTSEVSFNDISRLKGPGRYNTSSSFGMDTTPIIPVLGGPGGSQKGLNNVQYRKYMNHQKKMNLAQSARAMSLAGGGSPMAQQDPRSMSFTGDPSQRAMSLGRPMNGAPPNPRAMSLNSNPMLRNGNGPQPPGMMRRPGRMNGAPGFHPNQYPPNQNPQMMPSNHGPYQNQHTMSLRSGSSQQIYRGPNMGSRANSLNNSAPGNSRSSSFVNNGSRPIHPQMVQTGPMGHMSHMDQMGSMNQTGPMNQMGQQAYGSQGSFHQNYQSSPNLNGPPTMDPGYGNRPGGIETSTDSLMNVQEEEEEDSEKSSVAPQRCPVDEADAIYTFEEGEESPQISRKSTIKKSNSMRVRKLDLFKNDNKSDIANNDKSSRLSKYSQSAITEELPVNSEEDLNSTSTAKGLPQVPDKAAESDVSGQIEDSVKAVRDTNASPALKQSKRPLKFKNLVQNTAFNKFRSPSYSSRNSSVSEDIPKEIHSTSTEENKVFSEKMQNPGSRSSADLSDYDMNRRSYNETNSRSGSANSSFYSGGSKVDLVGKSLSDAASSSNLEGTTPKQSIISKEEEDLLRDLPDGVRDIDLESAVNSAHIKRFSSLSRSSSELKVQGIVPSSAILRGDTADTSNNGTESIRPRSNTSLSSKSRSFIKRISRTGSRRVLSQDEDIGDTSGDAAHEKVEKKPLKFTKEELSIMNCNNDLQNELQLVTNELALSIKRELVLESKVRSKHPGSFNQDNSEESSTELRKTIANLQEKLNKERKLRFISEEHAILAEHGQSPSALKLDYEKNEMYNQLLVKNDTVLQLQDKLEELQNSPTSGMDSVMLHKFNDLVRENTQLKEQLSNFENLKSQDVYEGDGDHNDLKSENSNHEYFESQIMSLKIQRDELREMITKLTTSQNVELKAAHDRVKTLETKLAKVNAINSSLSKRAEKTEKSDKFGGSPGGKLQGFSIVSQPKKFFDE